MYIPRFTATRDIAALTFLVRRYLNIDLRVVRCVAHGFERWERVIDDGRASILVVYGAVVLPRVLRQFKGPETFLEVARVSIS